MPPRWPGGAKRRAARRQFGGRSYKLQPLSTRKTPNCNHSKTRAVLAPALELDASRFSGAWRLELGASIFGVSLDVGFRVLELHNFSSSRSRILSSSGSRTSKSAGFS